MIEQHCLLSTNAQMIEAGGLQSTYEKLARALGADMAVNFNAAPAWHRKVLLHIHGEDVVVAREVGGQGTVSRSVAAPGVGQIG